MSGAGGESPDSAAEIGPLDVVEIQFVSDGAPAARFLVSSAEGCFDGPTGRTLHLIADPENDALA